MVTLLVLNFSQRALHIFLHPCQTDPLIGPDNTKASCFSSIVRDDVVVFNYQAKRGFVNLTGCDYSAQAIELARNIAKRENVKIEYMVSKLGHFLLVLLIKCGNIN